MRNILIVYHLLLNSTILWLALALLIILIRKLLILEFVLVSSLKLKFLKGWILSN